MNTAVYSVTHDNRLPLVTHKNTNLMMCLRTSIDETLQVCVLLLSLNKCLMQYSTQRSLGTQRSLDTQRSLRSLTTLPGTSPLVQH